MEIGFLPASILPDIKRPGDQPSRYVRFDVDSYVDRDVVQNDDLDVNERYSKNVSRETLAHAILSLDMSYHLCIRFFHGHGDYHMPVSILL